MTQHKWFKCPSTCDLSYCAFCRGGLALCTVCGGFEGTLTAECCGRRLTKDAEDAVHRGTLDFNGGEWVRCLAEKAGIQPQGARNQGERRDNPGLSTAFCGQDELGGLP